MTSFSSVKYVLVFCLSIGLTSSWGQTLEFLCISNDSLRFSTSNDCVVEAIEIWASENNNPFVLEKTVNQPTNNYVLATNNTPNKRYFLSGNATCGGTSVNFDNSDTLKVGLLDENITLDKMEVLADGSVQLSWSKPAYSRYVMYHIVKFTGGKSVMIGDVPANDMSTLTFTDNMGEGDQSSQFYYINGEDECGFLNRILQYNETSFLQHRHMDCSDTVKFNWNRPELLGQTLGHDKIVKTTIVDGQVESEDYLIINPGDTTKTDIINNNGALYRYQLLTEDENGEVLSLSNIIEVASNINLSKTEINVFNASHEGGLDDTHEISIWAPDNYTNLDLALERKQISPKETDFQELTNFVADNIVRINNNIPEVGEYAYRIVNKSASCPTGNTIADNNSLFLQLNEKENDLTLSWNALSTNRRTLQNYVLERKISGSFEKITIVDSGQTTVSIPLSELDNIDSLCFRISGVFDWEKGDELVKDTTISNVVCYEKPIEISAPNVFTPNGNNPTFKPFFSTSNVDQYSFRIFDRWGNMIFETTDTGKEWDGMVSNYLVTPDVYLYSIYIKSKKGEEKYHSGTVMVLH